MTSTKLQLENNKYYNGHRQRLRLRFLASARGSLPDYELLEIMLFIASPRNDVKPIAKQLLIRFGSLSGVITARHDELRTVKGINDAAIVQLKAVQDIAERLLKHKIEDKPILQSWKALIDYCRATMGYLKTEQFRLLFLDKKLMVMADELQEYGTIDQTHLYVREVVKRALQLEASSIIMVHNHPSGDISPSNADIQVTREVLQAAGTVGVRLHDHIIISAQNHYSFRAAGVI